MAMETFFITLFIIVFSVALGIIAYTLYGMSKKMPSSSDDKEDLLNERVIGLVKKDDVSMDNLSKMIQGILKS